MFLGRIFRGSFPSLSPRLNAPSIAFRTRFSASLIYLLMDRIPLATFVMLIAVAVHAMNCPFAFLSSDFAHSKLYERIDWGDGIDARAGKPEYLEWTAAQANHVANNWKKSGPRALLGELAKSRAELEIKISGTNMDPELGLIYGEVRESNSGGKRPFTLLGYDQIEPRSENLRRGKDTRPRELVLNALRRELAEVALRDGMPHSIKLQNGILSSYRDVGAVRVLRYESGPRKGLIWFQHPTATTAHRLLDECFAKLNAASAAEGKAREREISDAIYLYFQAMPYERGSAAIGNAFFPGVIKALTGKKVSLPDGVDFRAMSMDKESFAGWLFGTEGFRSLKESH